MKINCYPYPANPNIDKGFFCSGENNAESELGSIISISDGQGGFMYLDRAISGADLFICFFIFIFTIFYIAKTIFNFLLPKMISIKAKKN